MNVYRFIFFVGFLNLTIPFLGVPFVYKNYVLLALAVVTIVYSLILRAIEKEKESIKNKKVTSSEEIEQKTIEQVVDMIDEPPVMMDIKPRKRSRKKLVVTEHIYE